MTQSSRPVPGRWLRPFWQVSFWTSRRAYSFDQSC